MLTVKFHGLVGEPTTRMRLPRGCDPSTISRIVVIEEPRRYLGEVPLTHFTVDRMVDRYRVRVITEPAPYHRTSSGKYIPSQREPDGEPTNAAFFGFVRYHVAPRQFAAVNLTIDKCLAPDANFTTPEKRVYSIDCSDTHRLGFSPAPFGSDGFTLLAPAVLYDPRTRGCRDAPAGPIDGQYGHIFGFAVRIKEALRICRGSAEIYFAEPFAPPPAQRSI